MKLRWVLKNMFLIDNYATNFMQSLLKEVNFLNIDNFLLFLIKPRNFPNIRSPDGTAMSLQPNLHEHKLSLI